MISVRTLVSLATDAQTTTCRLALLGPRRALPVARTRRGHPTLRSGLQDLHCTSSNSLSLAQVVLS